MSKLDDILYKMVEDHIELKSDIESAEMFIQDETAAKQQIKALVLELGEDSAADMDVLRQKVADL